MALVAVASFVLMEPVTYLTHRYVMHGPGRRLHASHHRAQGGLEANDAFPALFAGVAMLVTLGAYQGVVPRGLLPVVVGVALYGAAYALVHDVYTHRRLPLLRRRHPRGLPGLDRLATAHALHHRYGGEPYGMLFPLLARPPRARAAGAGEPASGSTPPHVPTGA